MDNHTNDKSVTEQPARPKTAAGQMLEVHQTLAEIGNTKHDPAIVAYLDQLREQAPAAYASLAARIPDALEMVIELEPYLITHGRWANRHKDAFISQPFTELRNAIQISGRNTQPIYVREIFPVKQSDPILVEEPAASPTGPRYEVISGHRRLQACRELGLRVRAIVLSLFGIKEPVIFGI